MPAREAAAGALVPEAVGAAREAALRLLDGARRTRSDLARRLRDKGHAAAAVNDALDRLAAVGLVDDVEYARAYLAGRWGRKPTGLRRLEQALRVKGVASDDIARARALIEEREGAVSEVEAARRAVEQAARRYASLDARVRRQRLYALLMRKGFDGDVIRGALDLPDAEG